MLADDVRAYTLQHSIHLRMLEGLIIDRFDDITLEQYQQHLKYGKIVRKRLADINLDQLSGDELITYEILAFQYMDDGTNDDDYWLTFDITPYQAPYLFHSALQVLATHNISDATSANHYLTLVGELADIIDQLKKKIDGQVKRGIYLPKIAIPGVRTTWQKMKIAVSTGVQVAEKRLNTLDKIPKVRFTKDLRMLIEMRLNSGFDTLLATISETYETHAPDKVGLGQYPNGLDVYKRKIRTNTSLNLSIEEIHKRGKKAVADVAARMKVVRDALGFKGSALEFHDQLKKDQRFIAKSPADVEARYMQYIRRIEPKLDAYFKGKPKAAYGIRRLLLSVEEGMTFGYYGDPTITEPVGYYNYNGSDLANRSLISTGTLIYHELLPGHHFHFARQLENETLQDYRKSYDLTAFTEGWAEYAASLGFEMGLYETSYDLYGRYIMEIFLASRLVVDTGMNALGWSIEEARTFMKEYLFLSDKEIDSETIRYATSIPAQALAYRLGYDKIWEFRKRTEVALGDKFDIRTFHNLVLSDGCKLLLTLESKVNRFIAANKEQK